MLGRVVVVHGDVGVVVVHGDVEVDGWRRGGGARQKGEERQSDQESSQPSPLLHPPSTSVRKNMQLSDGR